MYSPLDIDRIIRTVYGEAALEPAQGQQAVASVILNRARASGMSPADIVMQPNQFEPWSKRREQLEGLKPDSPIYKQISERLKPLLEGSMQDPTGGADHFYSPTAQKALGRSDPSWAAGQTGTDIGRHRFYKLGYGGQQPQQVASAQPMQLGQPADMAQGIDTSRGSVTGGMNPIEDPTVKGMFLQGGGTGIQTKPEMPMDISPEASGAGLPAAEAAEEAEAAGQMPEQSKPGFFDRLRSAGVGPALTRFGAGLAAGANRGWGAGIGMGLEGAADAMDRQRTFNLAEQKMAMENMPAAMSYPLLKKHFEEKGDPDASRKAFLIAFNPKAAEALGYDVSKTENFGVNPEYFTTPDGKLVIGQAGDRGSLKFMDVQGNELKGDALKGLKRESGIRTIDLPDKVVVQDKSGNFITEYPKNNTKAAQDKQLGEEQAKAQAALPSVRSNAAKIKELAAGVLNDPEQLAKFTGWQGYIPTVTPEGRSFKKKLVQLDKRSYMIAFEGLKGAGAITEQEGKAATDAMARLNELEIDDEGYIEALKDFVNEVDRLAQVVELKAAGKWGGDTQLDRVYPTEGGGAPVKAVRRLN
jgi:hypothetical protein